MPGAIYVPKPPTDAPWQMPNEWQNSAPIQILGHKPTSPTKQWRYDYVPDPPWMMPVEWENSAIIQILGHKPTAHQKLWRWDYVPPPPWNMPSFWMDSEILIILDHKPTSPQKLWRYDYTIDTFWLGQPVASNIEFLTPATTQNPFVNPPWRYHQVDQPIWVGQPISIPINTYIIEQQGRAPVYVPRPAELQFWNAKPIASLTISLPITVPFFNPKQFNYVPEPPWVWSPPPSNILRELTAGGVPFSKLWRYDYHIEQPLWLGTPQRSYTLPLPEPTPFFNPKQFNYVPDPVWTGTPKTAYALQILDYKPTSPTKQWRWDYVPPPDWIGKPIAAYSVNQPFTQLPFSKQWRYDYVEQPWWVGTPQPAYTLENLVRGGKPFHLNWQFAQATYVPPTNWVGTPQAAYAQYIPPPAKLPFLNQWNAYTTYQPDTVWTWIPFYPTPIINPPGPPPPPVPPKEIRQAIKNIRPVPFFYGLSSLFLAPPPPHKIAITHVHVGESANIIIPLELPYAPESIQSLLFVRPDGSQYYVGPGSFLFTDDVFSRISVIYTTAHGELSQRGWWAVYYMTGGALSAPFAFWIYG